MDQTAIEAKVKELVCKQLGVDEEEIEHGTSWVNDLGADSLDNVELIMEFEDAFSITIPEEDAQTIETVGDAIDYLKEKLSQE